MSEDQVVEAVASRVAASVARAMRGIVPERLYPPDEAAELIGIRSKRRAKTIRDIPATVLPYVKYGPNNGFVGYWGRDLIAYVERQRVVA